MREVTQGQLDRYAERAQQVRGGKSYMLWAAGLPYAMGRREELKALRDFMGASRVQQARENRKREAFVRSPWRHEAGTVGVIIVDDPHAGLLATSFAEARPCK